MTSSARTDDIDALVSSVRDFVSHKDTRKAQPNSAPEKLVLTEDQRVTDPDETPDNPEIPDVLPVSAADDREDATSEPEAEDSALNATAAEIEATFDATEDDDSAEAPKRQAERELVLAAVRTLRGDSEDSPLKTPEIAAMRTATGGNPPMGMNGAATAEKLIDPAENLMAAVSEDLDAQAALRAMIVDVIREELAGELGERMTRNVRKLIRREINRVLVSRDLERD